MLNVLLTRPCQNQEMIMHYYLLDKMEKQKIAWLVFGSSRVMITYLKHFLGNKCSARSTDLLVTNWSFKYSN